MIAAAEVLILTGENGGDLIFAHIAIIRAFRPREPKTELPMECRTGIPSTVSIGCGTCGPWPMTRS